MTPKQQTRFIVLSQEMAAHTAPECAKTCRAPHFCCDSMYCRMAIDNARDNWGIALLHTGHKTLPLMGPTGCTAPPHLRPICTVHTCQISGFGFKPGDPAWTKKYFSLRNKLERMVDLP